MKRTVLAMALALFSVFVSAQEQPKIAVFPFEDLDNIFVGNESLLFYRRFSNEFVNRNSDRFTIVPRQDVERLINTEAKFQLKEFSAREKTAEMERVLNGTRILSGIIARAGNKLTISVSLYNYPTLSQLPGGVDLDVANKDELTAKIPELVQGMMRAMTGGGTSPTGGATPTQTTIPANFVRIEGGTFTMGSPSNEPERSSVESPQHQVTVRAFYMGKYQVTQAEYEAVMRTNPSNLKGANLPVENVSWYDAIEYCNLLSQWEGLRPVYTIDKGRSDPNNTNSDDNVRWLVTWNQNANGYRLPTEAEWEYACRAGTTTPFNTGNNITTSNANYNGNYPYNNNSKGTYRERTTTVGSFAPNPWGLYDMHGNVWEWCWDWYGSYSSGAQTDPRGAVSGDSRVIRGGSWYFPAWNVRSAARDFFTPSYRGNVIGFRLVRN
jgi:formylglycine-generating enzyme required for sulfatase activity